MKIRILALALTLALSASTYSQTAAYKTDGSVNPILPYNLCADPTSVVYDGRLYVYGTNDQQELNTTKNTTKNTYGKITQLVCMSTADMVNWTFHGTIDVKAAAPWIATSWAPSIVSREEKDGKTHFYLYFTNTASGIGVLTATSPTGPWKDPIGRALIDWSTPGRGNQSNIIDPGVCIDDEGNGWLSFGGGDPNSSGSKLMPGNARIVKLGSNMTSLSGTIKEIPAPFHFEANELNYINGKFLFSYSGGWSCNSGDWSKYTGRGSYPCPGNCSILSMTTDDPINGTWKYNGEVLKNPGNYGYPWGNNHSHMEKFGSNWYTIYHTQYLESKYGISGGYRGIAINKVSVNEKTLAVTPPSMTNEGATFLSANRINTAERIEAETMANCAGIKVTKPSSGSAVYVNEIESGDWTCVRNMLFKEATKSITVRLKGKGKLHLRASLKGTDLATIEFSASLFKEYTVDLNSIIPANKNYNYLYFVFDEITSTAANTQFDRYQFHTLSAEEYTPVENIEADKEEVSTRFYSLNGVQLKSRPQRGVFIKKTQYSDGTQSSEKVVLE